MADGIPPWLNIDPLRPVQFFLQGTSTGVGAAEARNRAQAAAMELAQRAAAQQAANERAALAAQADAAQTAARIQDLQQQRELNEQKAMIMAKQYAASNNIRDAIARGVPKEQAIYENPDFFLTSPGALAQFARGQQVTPGTLERNITYLRQLDPSITDEEAATLARTQIAKETAPPLTTEQVKQRFHRLSDGTMVFQSGPNTFTALQRPSDLRRMSDLDRKEYDAASRSLRDIDKQLDDPIATRRLERAGRLAEFQERRAGITNKLGQIILRYQKDASEEPEEKAAPEVPTPATGPTPSPEPTPEPANIKRDKTQDRQEGQRLLKQMEKFPELQQKIRARFKEFYGEDL